MVFANDFAPCDGKLRVYSVGHAEKVKKADAFVICYGKDVYLIDGGHTDTYHGLSFLLGIRKKYLKKHKELLHDIDCKLRINLIVSHFHVDHVEALISNIAVNAFIDIADVYLPEHGRIPKEYLNYTKDSEAKYRPYLMKILEDLHPRAIVTTVGFGEENVIEIPNGDLSVTFYPFPFDPFSESYLKYMCDIYAKLALSENGIADTRTKASTYALNAGSMWVSFRLGENTFLFTGDTMKRLESCDGEALDIMLRTYRDRIGNVTVLKYVHHGFARDAAAPLMLSMSPRYVVMTTQIATAEQAMRALSPDTDIKFVNSGLQTVLFECDKDSGTELTYIEE